MFLSSKLCVDAEHGLVPVAADAPAPLVVQVCGWPDHREALEEGNLLLLRLLLLVIRDIGGWANHWELILPLIAGLEGNSK